MADRSPLDNLLAQLSRSTDPLVRRWAKKLREQGQAADVEEVVKLEIRERVETSPRGSG